MSIESFYQRAHLTSPFGDGRNGGRKHRGVDFSHSTRPGTIAIPALLSGVVVAKLAPASWHGFGHQVTIESSFGGKTVRFSYAHLSSASPLRVGQKVAAGATVGYEGNTGSTTGSCTHIELLVDGGYINPAPTIESIRIGGNRAPASTVNQTTKNRQAWLNTHRGEKLAVDGREGPLTRAAYKRYQTFLRAHGYTAKIDGIWGAGTQAAHLKYAASLAKPTPTKRPTLRRGSRGDAVELLQRTLKAHYPLYASKLVIDSIFGPAVEKVVREFQRRAGLVVDGIVGPKTWAALGL